MLAKTKSITRSWLKFWSLYSLEAEFTNYISNAVTVTQKLGRNRVTNELWTDEKPTQIKHEAAAELLRIAEEVPPASAVAKA